MSTSNIDMAHKKLQSKQVHPLRILAILALAVVAAYLLAAHWHTVHRSLNVARHASIGWLVLSLLLTALTFCIAAGIYGFLALKPLRYRETVVVELASAFTNRLLPAGLGSLGLHGLYLHVRKHTTAQATAIVSVNNLLGIFAHLLLLFLLICVRHDTFERLFGHYTFLHWQYAAIAAVVAAILLATPKVKNVVRTFVRNLFASIRLLKIHKVLLALCLALALTATYTMILYGTAHGIGLQLDILQVFVVFSIGMLVGTATPTPGGLVGAEAGLFAGFVGYGVSDTAAAAAVLLYRLLTYWLPLVPGVFALYIARSRKLV